MKQLLLQFAESSEGGMIKHMLRFLKAQGFRQHFEEQEQELRDCLVQLSAVLNVVQVTSQVGAAATDDARPHSSHTAHTDAPLPCYVNAHPASCSVQLQSSGDAAQRGADTTSTYSWPWNHTERSLRVVSTPHDG
jgi:hypothetical protein